MPRKKCVHIELHVLIGLLKEFSQKILCVRPSAFLSSSVGDYCQALPNTLPHSVVTLPLNVSLHHRSDAVAHFVLQGGKSDLSTMRPVVLIDLPKDCLCHHQLKPFTHLERLSLNIHCCSHSVLFLGS